MNNPLKLPKQEDVQSIKISDTTIHVVNINDKNRDGLLEIILSQYVGKQCLFCRVILTHNDLTNAVRANNPPNEVELAHEECFDKFYHV